MTSYLVSWYIDIESDNPEEAAWLARECMVELSAVVFEVTDENGVTVIVDLLEKER